MRDFKSIQELLSLTRRAVDNYNMINKNETIAVGVSGGKDSLALLCTLKALSRFHPSEFNVKAITLDTGLPGGDISHITDLCQEIGVEHIIEKIDIYKIVFELRKEKNPCSLCANLRRGALNDLALRHKIKKIALGHHMDDSVETFFLNLYQEGRIASFSPVTYLDRKDVTIIRPFIYIEERLIKNFVINENIKTMPKCCPAEDNTERDKMKFMIESEMKKDPAFKNKIFGAMERAGISGYKEFPRERRTKSK